MLRRLASLRLRLVTAMVLTAAAGLTVAYVAISAIEHAEERAIVRQDAHEAAAAVAAQAQAGANRARFRSDQVVLANDQLLVDRGGRRVFTGPPGRGDLTATVTRPFPGGRVVVIAHANETQRVPIDLTLVLGLVIALVILAAAVTATLIVRAVREPIERTVVVADRVAAGDFSARIGTAGPTEFARLGRAFDGMAARLEASNRQQREFLADIAHEIATPVNAIAGFAHALADGTASDEHEREEAARTIADESERLETLVADLRRLTRLDAAEAVRVEPVDVGKVCRELGQRLEPAARAAGLRLHVDVSSFPTLSNRRLLEAVIVNLLTNAIRYTPAGGHVELRTRRRRGELAVVVSDTGIGISPEHRERIFDRLYRVDEARDRARGGSGLGLAIAQRAAHELGGRIEVESEVGKGSLFTLVLPERRSRTAPLRPPRASTSAPGGSTP